MFVFVYFVSCFLSALAKKTQSVIQTLKKDGVLTTELEQNLRSCRSADELDHVVRIIFLILSCIVLIKKKCDLPLIVVLCFVFCLQYSPYKKGSKLTKARRAKALGLEVATSTLMDTPHTLDLMAWVKPDTEGEA